MLYKRNKYHPIEQKVQDWKNKYLYYILWTFLLICVIRWLVKKYLPGTWE